MKSKFFARCIKCHRPGNHPENHRPYCGLHAPSAIALHRAASKEYISPEKVLARKNATLKPPVVVPANIIPAKPKAYVSVAQEVRDRLGLTHQQFARALGSNASSTYRWETTGSAPPSGLYNHLFQGVVLELRLLPAEDGLEWGKRVKIALLSMSSLEVLRVLCGSLERPGNVVVVPAPKAKKCL